MRSQALAPTHIARAIHLVRGERVLLDADLAALYGVTTAALNQAVRRNRARFPADFMFRLTAAEVADLRSQFVISSSWGGRRRPPCAFTEHGVAMLSSVLRSHRAVRVNRQIMRTFVQLRTLFASNAHLVRRLDTLERKYDKRFRTVFRAIRSLITVPDPLRARIGF